MQFSTAERGQYTPKSTVAWLGIAAVLGSLAGLLWWHGAQQAELAEKSSDDVAEIELTQLRAEIGRAHFDEYTARLFEPFGAASSAEVALATQRRLEVTTEGLLKLEELGKGSGTQADNARQVVDVFDQYGSRVADAEISKIGSGGSVMQFEGIDPADSPPSAVDSLNELIWLDQVAFLIVHEVAFASFGQTPVDASEDVSSELEEFGRYVIDNGGYLGQDSAEPLADGWIPLDVVEANYERALDTINQVIAETDLWEADQWVRSLADGTTTPPPHDVAKLTAQVAPKVQEIRQIVDGEANDLLALNQAQFSSSSSTANFARYTAAAALLVALACLAVVIADFRHRSKLLLRKANVDPLTQVGNRNVLEAEADDYLRDSELDEHLVVMIDMDQFKVANDTYGHAAGDQLLQQLARGLQRIASSLEVAESTVVRLGGDEFVVTLHNQGKIDSVVLTTKLEDLRSEIVRHDDDEIPLRFSYGIAVASGSPNLQQMLDAADLRAYQEKSARLAARQADLSELQQRLDSASS